MSTKAVPLREQRASAVLFEIGRQARYARDWHAEPMRHARLLKTCSRYMAMIKRKSRSSCMGQKRQRQKNSLLFLILLMVVVS